jgi:hypothetical protein
MEITPSGVMWIIDVGRLNIFGGVPSEVVNGPPKLVLWDMVARQAVHVFVFPSTVAPYDSSFLNDIAVDNQRHIAYISDSGG